MKDRGYDGWYADMDSGGWGEVSVFSPLQDLLNREKQNVSYRLLQKNPENINNRFKRDNKRVAQARVNEWHDRAGSFEEKLKKADNISSETVDYMSNSFRPEYSPSKPIKYNNHQIDVKKVENSNFDIVTDVDSTRRNKAVRFVENLLNSVSSKMPVKIELPQIAVVDFEKHSFGVDAIGGYDRTTGILYINSKYNTTSKIIAYVNKQKDMFANNTEFAPLLHELGHKYYYDSIKNLAKTKNIEYNKAKNIIDEKILSYIQGKEISIDLGKAISDYARLGYKEHNYTEIVAESFTVPENEYANDLIKLVGEEL